MRLLDEPTTENLPNLNSEEEFLHDISTPLSVALYHVQQLKLLNPSTDVFQRLDKVEISIREIMGQLENRKSQLK